MATATAVLERTENPLDMIEQLAALQDWSCERLADDEVNITASGQWADYHMSFNWRDDLEGLHLACAFDFKVPPLRKDEIYRLIAKVNEQIWLGHFDLWSGEGILMYRNGLVLAGGAEANGAQCEALLNMAVDTCERYFPAFQYVIWAGRSADEALKSSLFETAGQA